MTEVTNNNDEIPQTSIELDLTSPEKIKGWVDTNVNYPQRGIAHKGRPDGTWPNFDEQVTDTRKVITDSLNDFLTSKMPPEIMGTVASKLVEELKTSYFSERPDLNNLDPWFVRHITTPYISFEHKGTLEDQLKATWQQEREQVTKDVEEGKFTVEEIQNDLMRTAHGDDAITEVPPLVKHKPPSWRKSA